MSDFIKTRYGYEHDGEPRGCPENMYPLFDPTYDETRYDTFQEFKEAAFYDSLNVLFGWWFHSEEDGGEFVMMWIMPRKGGNSWAARLKPGYDREEVEDWVEKFSKEAAAHHFGWRDNED